VIPEPYASDETLLLALCIWREARGEDMAAKLGVAWTVRNRCALAPREGWHQSIRANVLKPFAFSSFNAGDPNAAKYPRPDDTSWWDSVAAAESVEADPTMGGVFYYSAPITEVPRQWGAVVHSATIGGLQFYRLAPPPMSKLA